MRSTSISVLLLITAPSTIAFLAASHRHPLHGLRPVSSDGISISALGHRSTTLHACEKPVAPETAVAAVDDRPIDPKEALAELGELVEQIKVLWTEGKTWDAETRTEKRRGIVSTYVRVFAPAMAFSGTQLGLTLGAFSLFLIVLGVTGLGFDALQEASAGVPLLGEALQKVDPAWGNAAIALVLVEVCAPVLIPLAAALTPKATEALSAKLVEWNLDADGLNARIEKVLQDTS